MKKENTIITMIINLSKFIFSEIEFNKFISYIKLNLLAQMRLFVEEKLEYLETRLILYREDAVLEAQLHKCRKLDAAVTELYMDSLVPAT